MAETQLGQLVWRTKPLPGIVWAEEPGFAHYVPQPCLSDQRTHNDAKRFRCARNHYLTLAGFIELAFTQLQEYRPEIDKLAEMVEREHYAHSDTTRKMNRVDAVLRAKTEEYTFTIRRIASRIKDAQVEMGRMLESSELDVSDEDYERNEQVLVTLPTQSASRRLIRRLTTWLRRVIWRHEQPLSSDNESLRLRTKSINTSGGELKLILEDGAEKTAGSHTSTSSSSSSSSSSSNSNKEDDSFADEDGETMGDGLEKENPVDGLHVQVWEESPAYSVMYNLWQQHGAVRRTLLMLTKNMRAKVKGRAELQDILVGRRLTRMMVANQMNAVCGVRGHLRDAILQLAHHAEVLKKLGAETWPGEPQLEDPWTQRSFSRDLQQQSPFRRLCSLLCCGRTR